MNEPVTCILNFFPGPNTNNSNNNSDGYITFIKSVILQLLILIAVYSFFPHIFLFISNHERMDMYVQSGHLKYVLK